MQGVVEYDISRIKGPLANTFLILINALFFNVKLIGLYDVYPRDYSQQLLNEEDTVAFDFIIVGAGAAGCAAANRITEQELWSVLLIEAGDYPSPSTEVPGLYSTFPLSNEDWKFKLEKDKKACLAIQDQRCTVTKGKVLGGTSSINNMRYMRSSTENYDKNDFDNWSANVTYNIFDKIESYTEGGEEMQFHFGTTGQIHLHLVNFTGHPKHLLEESYRSTGYTKMPKRKFIGFTEHVVTIKNGERFNMAKAFLTPVKDRPNLFFTKKTEVEGIVVTEPVDKRASGVNVSIDGTKFFIRAKKEVILTAGAINNAKLLLVSGIGPSQYLTDRRIPVYADIPAVGKNLQFHLTVPLYVAIEPSCESCPKDYYRELDLIGDVSDYVIYRNGNLSTIGINEFAAYIQTKKFGATVPNVAIHHSYFKIGDRNLLAWLESMNYHPKIVDRLIKYNNERAIIKFLLTLIQPTSMGEVLLNETHFLSNPTIIPKFFSDDENLDYDILFSGFNFVTNLTESSAMKRHNAQFLNLDIPNCRNYKFCTKQYVKCYIFNMAYPKSDVVGTARMGVECDNTAVVRNDLEVKKVRCLRVADSSVMRYMTVGNTVATDAMIGYNLGEILKEKWMTDYISPFHPRGRNKDDE